MTSQVAQTLTGHGGFAQYFFRFRLQDSPYCACDLVKIQDVLHVLEDCDMFLRERAVLEAEFGIRISGRHFPEILGDAHRRDKFVRHPVRQTFPCVVLRLDQACNSDDLTFCVAALTFRGWSRRLQLAMCSPYAFVRR
ncbi:hypothetical protein EVAR_63645_1 [Eumeta japonica]|uniref:Uncharacterized protein n=1 Tax=Eumeta variegata TaxID=151549 RepID=A0A4C1Z9N5_EUMVA|nr:hypothetical protein EVAR_63645_1 [Eumeta japonica]